MPAAAGVSPYQRSDAPISCQDNASVKPAKKKKHRAEPPRQMSVSTLTFVAATGEVIESPTGGAAPAVASTDGRVAGHALPDDWWPELVAFLPDSLEGAEDTNNRHDAPEDISDVDGSGGDDDDDVRSVSQHVPIVREAAAASATVPPVMATARIPSSDAPRARPSASQETTETFVATPPEYRRALAQNQPQKQKQKPQRLSGDAARSSAHGPPTNPDLPSAVFDRSQRADTKAPKAVLHPLRAAEPAGRSPNQGTMSSAPAAQSSTSAAHAPPEPLLEASPSKGAVAAMLLQRQQQQETASVAHNATMRALEAVERAMMAQRATQQARIMNMRARANGFIEEIDAVLAAQQVDDAAVDDVLRGAVQQLFDDINAT